MVCFTKTLFSPKSVRAPTLNFLVYLSDNEVILNLNSVIF